MGALLIDMLQRAQRSRRVVAMQSGGIMFLGYVVSFNPELVVMRTITRQGLLTGVRTISLNSVSQVHFDDRYVRLIEFKEHNPEVVYARVGAPDGLDDQYLTVQALLQRAHESHQLVLLETHSDHSLYGYVVRLTEDELMMEVYTQYGEPDGHTVLDTDGISSLVWSDEDTRTIELLIRQRNEEEK
ncbi:MULTISPECIES: hypothetical protein [Hymenobacter]|uniref:Uncharacterized protein n=1 Tax=Hymenobacter jejuensis TaxID=2502781 RepID=A0A5B8A4Y7_9BACT|nr:MULTISPECIES: hypothetical protein [Hymenobacter]MBC6990268.1 hypothetical protein [Hymenobacter sp. BT491]QDA62279.1 hypothetical protein FHG12_20215 [Hymenobacter jejuensis]